ncbi:hypothetical protein CDEST_04495 [Colletotrichum destructivum]|uniref:Uncharacterized protein n=1 Tax=Colletotrichum destructivum TaxID=34406 RepID=A0AAX4I8S8_9PEZI|nr:hypothetical protein CDEST_04495 [Colletotrichum destructivum]
MGLYSVGQDAARWWAAVLSTETGTTGTLNGWRASIRNDKGALLCSPWAIAASCNTPFVVVSAEQQPTRSCTTARTTNTRTTTTTTPSLSTPAPEASLAAALLIPIAKLDGARIELPSPKPQRDGTPAAAAADVSRADECRLMYFAHGPTHAVPPLFPFAPFGRTALQDADLGIRQHTQCAALHHLVYAGFAWDCQGGGRNVKQGAGVDGDADDALLVPFKTSELSRVAELDAIAVDYSGLDREDGDEICEMVTRNILCWLRGDDGYPVAERALRQHDDDDDGRGYGREDAQSLRGDSRLSKWLLGVATGTGRCNSLQRYSRPTAGGSNETNRSSVWRLHLD